MNDAERLDWLQTQDVEISAGRNVVKGQWEVWLDVEIDGDTETFKAETLREAIDIAHARLSEQDA